ncbi:hypothetical protein EIP91_007930 [Steccherinum ochraceum]|uniref:homogentisate 1,2-dioxygenase n=1 Tax=Steccherinum ochraceum TaxID=92696 RepID=A0A4R0S0K4_9APHY|nr:hypothetical protein EIP91_007930 [Steccherinum ochraceum]
MNTVKTTAPAAFDTHGYAEPRQRDPYVYQVGFGNLFASQALPGVLPEGQNTPQKSKYDLFPEAINGTPFTVPRANNQRTWFYRILPSVAHSGMVPAKQNPFLISDFSPSLPNVHVNANQVKWKSFEIPTSQKVDFIQGIRTMGGNGTAASRDGMAFHMYLANQSMEKTAFVNNDGDLLIVPEVGRLDIQTELGRLMVAPGEIAVVQAGMKFKVTLPDALYEVYGAHYSLPELGPLGANGMANLRDFEYPVASFEVDQTAWKLIYKIGGQLFECNQNHTPFDVVAWHGNYVPFKYDISKFIITQNVNKDHADPSLYCILRVPSKFPGISLLEFCAISGPFYITATNTFRPPFFHRNSAAEYVHFIKGGPGGVFGYNGFTPHGPTLDTWEQGTTEEQVPKLTYDGVTLTLIEPFQNLLLTDFAVKCNEFENSSVDDWAHTPGFLKHVKSINAELKAEGRPEIKVA